MTTEQKAEFRAGFEENPLDFGVDCSIMDRDGGTVELIGATPDLTNRIVRSLNYHDRLREALDRLVRSCDNLEYEAGRVALPASDAEDLLAELDNLEKQQ